ncbi:pseudouridine synthase [Kingella negevensis]|uniref:pseudouridine synthase n=1 Tax=Kingella negevensis TaxID=1522312 RepID=UPI00254B0899|nr:pseudouridine synthase [Kingella negevensis]MDK4681239.1 pseudouridine synthase [Kingella negevensis]MDK4683436.1 pseudouridine synthase [Kingella negevensis]MDK4691429.1 pseudouridine synthase [Kingella negevensis]MDK4693422.1 pseudouridine synthase [Kingella negevensis]MDK4700035.1 pseudouridine synthase [Kingella negevensis]
MLIVLNKPYGVICQFSAHEKHRSLKEFVPVPNVYPAGRLDTDSEGLLLLTDDGKQQARIADPRNKVTKTYWAQLEGTPNEAKLALLEQPLDLGDFIAQPAQVRVLSADEVAKIWQRNPPIRERKTVPDFWAQIQIREGKNRQVRRMTAKAGFPCLRLIRVGIGRVNLFDLGLELGKWQECQTLP